MTVVLEKDCNGRILKLEVNGDPVDLKRLVGLEINMNGVDPSQLILKYAPEQLSLELDDMDVLEHDPDDVIVTDGFGNERYGYIGGPSQEGIDHLVEVVNELIQRNKGLEHQHRITKALLELMELEVDRLKVKLAGHGSGDQQ